LKQRLKEEGSVVVTKCHELKFMAKDGKYYVTDAADTETVLRLIQSIPSPNAEPFKLWLARVGYERVEETEDPEKAIQRALATYLKKGYSKEWVDLRLKTIEIRKDLTNERQRNRCWFAPKAISSHSIWRAGPCSSIRPGRAST
jgi:hypothetical protein